MISVISFEEGNKSLTDINRSASRFCKKLAPKGYVSNANTNKELLPPCISD